MKKADVKKILDKDKATMDLLYEKLYTIFNSHDKKKLEEIYNEMLSQRNEFIKKRLGIK